LPAPPAFNIKKVKFFLQGRLKGKGLFVFATIRRTKRTKRIVVKDERTSGYMMIGFLNNALKFQKRLDVNNHFPESSRGGLAPGRKYKIADLLMG